MGKLKAVHSNIAVILSDIKMHLNSSPVKFFQHFQRTSSLKLLGKFHLDLICSLQAKGGKSLYIWSRSH